jgi:hypothetical protein
VLGRSRTYGYRPGLVGRPERSPSRRRRELGESPLLLAAVETPEQEAFVAIVDQS